MKIKITTASILILYCLTTSFQCNKCKVGDLHLDGTRSWLPLKDKKQLTFLDNSGSLTNFSLQVIDTTETSYSECGDSYKYEYIKTSLFLNTSMTDSIHFILGSGGWLCMTATSNNTPNITMCNVFGQTKEGIIAKKLSNYSIGNKNYQEVILLLHNPGYSNNIDSVFIANNVGYVGFTYLNKRYFLQ
jgi:hypothetical protein